MDGLLDQIAKKVDLGIKQEEEGADTRLTGAALIKKCLPQIKHGRDRGLSWQQITNQLQAAAQELGDPQFTVTVNTVKSYYYRLTGKKRRKRRSTNQRKATPKASQVQAPKPSQSESSATERRGEESSQLNGQPSLESVSSPAEQSQASDSPKTDLQEGVKEPEPAKGKAAKGQSKKKTRFNQIRYPGAKPINVL